MKTFRLACFLTLSLVISSFSSFHHKSFSYTQKISIENQKTPRIKSESYILIDYYTGKILAEKNANTRRNPASLTKMMTSYTIAREIKNRNIQDDDVAVIGKDAWASGNSIFKNSSLMFLKPKDHVKISQLRRGIVLQSGNDACVAMADYISGNENAFVKLMNNYVKTLNLRNTHFKTVHGLDINGQYSSAHDMALIGKALIHDAPEEYEIYKEKEFKFNNINQKNRNKLLWDDYLKVDGIKTGYTQSAGYNLVASATEGNMRLISTIMGGHSYKEREIESKKLLTWGFRSFKTKILLKANQKINSKRVWFGSKPYVDIGVTQNIYLTIPVKKINNVKTSYTLNKNKLFAPLKKNTIIGSINFKIGKNTIEQRPLIILNEISKGCFLNRTLDKIRLIFDQYFKRHHRTKILSSI